MFKPFPWPAEKLSTNYCVGVGRVGLLKILNDEKFAEGNYVDYLNEALEEIDGVENVRYDGHYDPFVYFSVRSNVDNEAAHLKIIEVIKRFIENDI